MLMKSSRKGIGVLIAAAFLWSGSYGQDSAGVKAPTGPQQTNPSESIPANLTPAQIDSITAEILSAPTHREPVKEQKQDVTQTAPKTDTVAKKSEVRVAPTHHDAVKAQTPDVAKTEAKIDTVAKKNDSQKALVAPITPAPAIAKKASDPGAASSHEAKSENVLELENDVVVGYGTMKKEDLTGSVVSIKSDALVKDAVFSIRKALQGRAAGVTVTSNSGAPGRPPRVNIRGVGTINNSEPLYVVDGAPASGVDFLNPDDIESMTILKDASATAIYGSRGANGVVMVTTKKAKEGINRVDYSMYIGTQNPWKKPSLCNAEQWAILNNEAMRAANMQVYPELENPSGLGAGTDWFGQITNKNALIQQQNVSIIRGVDNLKYFLSAGHFDQEGIIKGSECRRETFRTNTENKVAPWFTLGNNLGLTHTLTNYANESDEWNSVLVNALAIDPVTKPRDSAGNLLPSVFNNAKNPVGIIENTNVTGKRTAISGTVFSNIDIAHLLKLNTTFGLDWAYNDSTEFLPKYYISPSDRNDNARLTRKTSTDNTWVLENTISYQNTFADEHTLKVMVGTEALDREWDSVYAQNQTTATNDSAQRVLDATKGQQPIVKGRSGGNSMASFFGRLEYNYGNRYLLTATFRRDGSSRFGAGHQWGDFPSVAGAWKISQEPFMKDVPYIEGLKLRLGWGTTGNQDIPDYLYSTFTTGNQNYPLGGNVNSGTTFLSSGNKNIHWEGQEAINGGLDVNAFRGKIEFTGDVFVKRTNDMLIQKTIPLMAGSKTPPMDNVGSIENKGVELVLNYKEAIGDFQSNLGVNFSTYSNRVVSLNDTSFIADATYRNSSAATHTQVNHPVGCFYGYKTNGIFQNWNEINSFTYVDKDKKARLVQPNAKPGDIRYRDDDHDGVPDQGYIGSPHPDFIMGLSADVAYKSFDVSVLFQVVYGNQIFNGTRWYTENGTAYFNLDTRMLDRWTGEGTTTSVDYPRMNQKDANPNGGIISDRYIEDGSYVRVKSLQLGYSLSEKLCKKLWIKKCRVYVGAENLLTFTRYSGLDPEIGTVGTRNGITNSGLTLGMDYITYPQARTFLAGLNLTL
jgi:TonB-dependent starch-binding outer membrane protein SusC